MTRVYVDMVADLFHYGHANFLKQAKKHGSYLIVGIHSDKVVEGYKRSPIMTMEERLDTVSSCRYVDEVVPNAPLIIDQKWLDTHQIDLVVHGFADKNDENKQDEFYKIPRKMNKFQTIPYYYKISTTSIINTIKNII